MNSTIWKRVLVASWTILATCMVSAMTRGELQALIDSAAEGARVEVTDDFTLDGTLSVSKSLTLASPEGTTNTILRSGNGICLALAGETTTLRLENLVFDGNSSGGSIGRFTEYSSGCLVLGPGTTVRNFEIGGDYAGILLTGTAHLEMEAGATLRSFQNNRYAPCVDIESDEAVFEMRGGLITDCHGRREAGTSYEYDGAVYVWKGGTFNMWGGEISDNTAATSTDGVDVYDKGTFNMYGGLITRNTGGVGGVFCKGGVVRLSGGVVTGNTGAYAGGLYVQKGELYLSGDASITNNVGGTVNDVFLDTDTDYYAATGKNPEALGYILEDYTGVFTIYSTYEPVDSLVDAYSFESWVKNVFVVPDGTRPGLGRIRCQNHPEFGFDGVRDSKKWIYWAIAPFRVDGVHCNYFSTEVLPALTGPSHVVELLQDVQESSSVSFPLDSDFQPTNLIIRSGAGTNCVLTAEGGKTALSVSKVDLTVRLENVTVRAQDNSPSILRVMAGRVELGAGAVLERGRMGVALAGDDADLLMEDGAILRDVYDPSESSFGFGVRIGFWEGDLNRVTTPRFEMRGGLITNCVGAVSADRPSSSGYGGVVYAYGGDFTMTGGRICGNICTNSAAGVVVWSGNTTVRFGGDAVIEGNFGESVGLYVASGNVSYFGDFRGHVEVSNLSQEPEGTFKIKAETGATGAWSFLAAAADPAVRLVGVGQGDGQLVKWGAVAGTVDGVEIASVADANILLPSVIATDVEGLAKLPHVLTGVAAGVSGTIAIDCSQDELKAAGVLPLKLVTCSDGAFTGALSFTLPATADKLVYYRSGNSWVLDNRRALMIVIR